ncbi:hygromycin-B 7''-O-kinase [Amycolatopsis arida]|uniref:Hygromycin-B 7''-O-kinase n=1 Tax=Amycolatopsis arida TaxID=587909 RepID=A0A1I5LHR6_9PSEU|nr:aminoglycoside 3'-phosphotransferase/choline kinase family protein [Amycolatopsis arida]TDX93724.1 hygromycin-B 7''-O-kinase [Amycolatopsis arida]SFO96745.1 hygromycin-B 7''-O-kinase [Amycolatopsis arida]
MTLPLVETEEQYDAITEERLRPAVTALCRRLGHADRPVDRFADGSLPVYAIGDELVLKLYSPVDAGEAVTETTVLRALDGRLPVPTPGVVDTGEADGWRYVLMRRLTGRPLPEAWPELSPADRTTLARQLGEALAALHAVRDPALAGLEPRDWPAFVAAQRATAVERQRRAGLDAGWLAQITSFLDTVDLVPGPPALLHTEVMREHLLVTREPNGWRLSGLFDFEPAMPGAPEYEFAAVGLFFSRGDAAVLREVLRAYGYLDADLDEALSRRLLAYTLLHRYANLSWYLRELPAPREPTLNALATTWFGVQ